MRVTTEPVEQKPDIVITLSWREALVLREICGCVLGKGYGREVTNELHQKFGDAGLTNHNYCNVSFSGKFIT